MFTLTNVLLFTTGSVFGLTLCTWFFEYLDAKLSLATKRKG